MFAYHVEWHLRQAWAPLLFHDTGRNAARAERSSPVAKTGPSEPAKVQEGHQALGRGPARHRLRRPDRHLGTLTRNTVRVPPRQSHRFTLQSTPTALQEAAFKLLDLDPARVQQTKNLTPTFSRRTVPP